MSCTNATPPFVCLGTLDTAALCAALAESASVGIYTWSPGTHHCWTRSDGQWEPLAAPGLASGCDDAAINGCAPPTPLPPTSNLSASVGTTAIATTHSLHPAVTFDFWRSDDARFGEKWGNSSALTIDLTSPTLRAAAAALAPALLRLGGSPEDSVNFDSDGSCVPQSGGAGPFPGYFCSQVQPYSYDCLTRARWAALLQFASETGNPIAYGLNGCYGRPSASSPMNRSNAAALFAATAASPHAATGFYGFELTNLKSSRTRSRRQRGRRISSRCARRQRAPSPPRGSRRRPS